MLSMVVMLNSFYNLRWGLFDLHSLKSIATDGHDSAASGRNIGRPPCYLSAEEGNSAALSRHAGTETM